MSIADWSDTKILQARPESEFADEIVRLRAELASTQKTASVALDLGEQTMKILAEALTTRDALASQVAALEGSLSQVAALRSAGAKQAELLRLAHLVVDPPLLAVLADTSKAAEQHDADLVRKERGMVACLQRELTDVLRCLTPIIETGRISQGGEQRGNWLDVDDCWKRLSKVLADGAGMAAEHDARVRAECRPLQAELTAAAEAVMVEYDEETTGDNALDNLINVVLRFLDSGELSLRDDIAAILKARVRRAKEFLADKKEGAP